MGDGPSRTGSNFGGWKHGNSCLNRKKTPNYSKSRIIPNPRKCTQSSASGLSSREQVGGRCPQHGRGTRTHQSGRRMPTSRRGPQPPIPHTTSQDSPPPTRRPVALLSATAEVGVPARRARRVRAHAAVRTGAWQCLRLLKIAAPSQVLHDQPPATRPSFSKVGFSSVEQRTSASAQLCPARSSDVQHRRAGCSLPGTELCTPSTVQVHGHAPRASERKSSLLGDEEPTAGGGRREEGSAAPQLPSEGCAPSFIYSRACEIHVKVKLQEQSEERSNGSSTWPPS